MTLIELRHALATISPNLPDDATIELDVIQPMTVESKIQVWYNSNYKRVSIQSAEYQGMMPSSWERLA